VGRESINSERSVDVSFGGIPYFPNSRTATDEFAIQLVLT